MTARDALVAATGIPPGEIDNLRKDLAKTSVEREELQRRGLHGADEIRLLKTALAEHVGELAAQGKELGRSREALGAAERELAELRSKIAELSATLEGRDKELAKSLSLSGLDENAAQTLRLIGKRMKDGGVRFATEPNGSGAMVVAEDGAELRSLIGMLKRRDWRLALIRWILGLPKS